MFTGLIEDVGTMASLAETPNGWKLSLRTGLPVEEIETGDSVSVNGACLTVESTRAERGILAFHALNETLDRTNLKSLSPGDAVNIERALRLGDRLGGHIVNGHVDACATVRSVLRMQTDIEVTVVLADRLAEYVIDKGSVALNGVSLTVASVGRDSFSVRIIPETWQRTNLRFVRAGDRVNFEVDVLGKYIRRQTAAFASEPERSSVTMGALAEAGFLSS